MYGKCLVRITLHNQFYRNKICSAVVFSRLGGSDVLGGYNRGFVTSAPRHCKGENVKEDPDVKKLLREINKDFEVINKHEKVPLDKDKNDNDENAENGSRGKKISELLSELYGEEGENKDKFSSVGGYKEYVDSDSAVIYDVDEEREIMEKAYAEGKPLETYKKVKSSPALKYKHLADKRGDRGVFEVPELLKLLKAEKILDLAVMTIPASMNYADFMVVGTARSTRHLRTVTALVVSVFKQKRLETDPIPRREGERDTNTGWTALDMGNIVMHLLVQEQREYYDLEMLWTVGAEFDDNTRLTRQQTEAGHNFQKIGTLEELMATDVDKEELFKEQMEVQSVRDLSH